MRRLKEEGKGKDNFSSLHVIVTEMRRLEEEEESIGFTYARNCYCNAGEGRVMSQGTAISFSEERAGREEGMY